MENRQSLCLKNAVKKNITSERIGLGGLYLKGVILVSQHQHYDIIKNTG